MLIFSFLAPAHSQQSYSKTRILFVFDASGSMYGKWQGKLKMESAKNVLIRMIDSLRTVPHLELALRVYGHQFPRNCEDSKLEVPFKPNNSNAIIEVIKSLTPKGITPIAYSLEQAATDFPSAPNVRNIIILITDGIEECSGDPCAVSQKLQENQVVMKPFVIGLGIDPTLIKGLQCMGRFYNAGNETSLSNIMKVVVANVLDNTTIQVKLLDHNNLPTETNVAMTFSDISSGVVYHNYVHTLNDKQQPDKFTIDASPIYNLTIHTLPPIYKRNIELAPGENNVIDISAIQGDLSIKMSGSMYYRDLKCLVYKANTKVLVNVQDINSTVKYLAGKYDIEVLTTPVTMLKDVEIQSKSNTNMSVENPGQVVVSLAGSFAGGLYVYVGTKLELIKVVSSEDRRDLLYLQPGRYKYVLRPNSSPKTLLSQEKEFFVRSNGVVKVTVN